MIIPELSVQRMTKLQVRLSEVTSAVHSTVTRHISLNISCEHSQRHTAALSPHMVIQIGELRTITKFSEQEKSFPSFVKMTERFVPNTVRLDV